MITADAPTTGRHARPYDHDAENARIARTGIFAWGKHRRSSRVLIIGLRPADLDTIGGRELGSFGSEGSDR